MQSNQKLLSMFYKVCFNVDTVLGDVAVDAAVLRVVVVFAVLEV